VKAFVDVFVHGYGSSVMVRPQPSNLASRKVFAQALARQKQFFSENDLCFRMSGRDAPV
jgi:hypothetical protein